MHHTQVGTSMRHLAGALCRYLCLIQLVCACNAGSRVGYHVRLDAAMTRSTRLLFCTTGILLRRLGGDLQLPEVSHIIVDEVRHLKGLS